MADLTPGGNGDPVLRVFSGSTAVDLQQGPGWAWIGLSSVDGLNRLRTETLEALDRLFIALRWGGTLRVALSSAQWMEGRSGNLSAGADARSPVANHPAPTAESPAASPTPARNEPGPAQVSLPAGAASEGPRSG